MRAIPAREIALRVLVEHPGKARPDEYLERLLTVYDPERSERALSTQLVSGTIKWRLRLDYVIKRLSRKKRVASPAVLNVLRLSLYQLMFLDRVPDYGAVNEGVKLAKRYGDRFQGSYVNAVLRRFLREPGAVEFPDRIKDPVGHISVVHSHPAWLVRRWLRRYSFEETVRLAEAGNRIPDIGLRVNTLRAESDEVETGIDAEGGEIVSRGFAGLPHLYVREVSPVERLKAHRDGLVQVQDASSTLVGRVLSPARGAGVVDLCSAPGGKATHLYELMGGEGLLIAGDRSLERLRLVRKNARRLGHGGMLYAVADGRRPPYAGVEYVLVDAPCTGLGVLARRWDIRWTKREGDIKRMAAYQRRLLEGALGVLEKGGILVYSTCSIEPEENEGVVEGVLEGRADVELEDIGQLVPPNVVYKRGMMQTLPHVHGVDGIFAARLRKVVA
jgi:16S rRNA (cytosine967-C5)-methyltransferase